MGWRASIRSGCDLLCICCIFIRKYVNRYVTAMHIHAFIKHLYAEHATSHRQHFSISHHVTTASVREHKRSARSPNKTRKLQQLRNDSNFRLSNERRHGLQCRNAAVQRGRRATRPRREMHQYKPTPAHTCDWHEMPKDSARAVTATRAREADGQPRKQNSNLARLGCK